MASDSNHDTMLNSISKHCHNPEAHLMVVIVDLPTYTSAKAILAITSKIDVILTSSINLVSMIYDRLIKPSRYGTDKVLIRRLVRRKVRLIVVLPSHLSTN